MGGRGRLIDDVLNFLPNVCAPLVADCTDICALLALRNFKLSAPNALDKSRVANFASDGWIRFMKFAPTARHRCE